MSRFDHRLKLTALLRVALLLALALPAAGAPPARAAAATGADAGRAGATIGARTELGIVTNAVSRRHAAPNAPIYADLLAGSGARWVREEFRWDLVEPQRGRFRWDGHDGAVAAYQSQGFRIIGLLAYSAGWAVREGVAASPAPPPRAEWSQYVAQTVGRYRDSVSVWEIWNEPDNRQYWRGDARAFAGLLADTAAVIRQNDPDAIVISGGVSDIAGGVPFLEAVGAAGGFDTLDGIGIHPYMGYHALLYGGYRGGGVERLREFQQRFGRPFWMTEFGFSSLLEGGGETGEAAQANGMVRQIVETAASGLDVRAMVVYDAADDADGGRDHSQNLGLFRYDGQTPKPAFHALQTLGRTLGGPYGVERIAGDDPLVTRYRFARGDGAVTEVVWTDGAVGQVTLNPVGPVETTDLFGARETLPSTLGQVVLAAGATPVYLTYRPAPEGMRFIEESGHTLSGAFLDEWTAAGGLAGLGLPLSEPMEERANTWVQYFERGRLEFDGAMRWGLTGAEVAGRYPAAARAPLRCSRAGEPRPTSPAETFTPLPPCPAAGQTAHYFPETGHLVANGMLAFWNAHGGLARFGLPLSEEFDDGPLRVQLFERARLEYHPDQDAITIGRTGAEAMALRRASWHLWPTSPLSADPGRVYFAQTRHALSPRAAQAWARFGGVALLGYPLSEEFALDGATTQLFERGRIVWSAAGEPSLALVGREYAARLSGPAARDALAPYACRTGGAPTEGPHGLLAGDTRPECRADAHIFPETGHSLRGGFRDFWMSNGGLPQFGYPISEEFVLDGVLVQYFERARFEISPEGQVRLSRVGAELIGR